MIADILKHLRKNVKHRVWVFSDLQQAVPENARYCLTTAVEDFVELEMPCERIWYLGDAVEGIDIKLLEEMSVMQMEVLGKLGIPVRYVLGNHDFDYWRNARPCSGRVELPFLDTAAKCPGWQSIESVDSWYFLEDMGDYAAVFFSDHADAAGRWFTSHGQVHGATDRYPYGQEEVSVLSRRIADMQKPVITLSHYAFAGGNRPSDLLNRLLPLPASVRLHFYGHAHIGDSVWTGKDCYRKIACVDHQNIPQINVSSLENRRGNAIRSVIMEMYCDNSFGIYFRNHTARQWEEFYLQE